MRPPSAHPAPSAHQLSYLKALAERTATSFAYPRTRAQASAEIDRLRRLEHAQKQPDRAESEEPTLIYATAPQPEEVSGYGASVRWRRASPGAREHARDTSQARDPNSPLADGPRRGHKPALRRLGSYTAARTGAPREVVSVAGAYGSTLIVDRLARDRRDPRLVARLAAEEPAENAEIVCRIYLDDETRGRCRRLRAEDLEHDPAAISTSAWGTSADANASLLDAHGRRYRIRQVACNGSPPELRWTRSWEQDGAFEALTLRHVVGALEGYEPARSITLQALRQHRLQERVSSCRLREELERVSESPIVLNRGLREAVQRELASGETSMSEIALRCGHVKRDAGGNLRGDTSWLARRIGLLPEGGEDSPTVWVHTDVLARIARDGLDISPREMELG